MNIIINETNAREELRYIFNGIDCTEDMTEAGGLDYDDEAEAYRMSAEDFAWWTQFFEDCTADDAEEAELMEALYDAHPDYIDAAYITIADEVRYTDMDGQHAARQRAFAAIREQYDI